jgi:cell wall-associated NlpC family hydrolase
MARAELIIAAARACVGVRFRLQGRDPATGLDCVGLVLVCARAIGWPVHDQADYVLTEDPARLRAALLAHGLTLRPVPSAGDIGLFESAGAPRHLGILTGPGLIHADIGLRRVVEHRLDAGWRERLVEGWGFDAENS